MFWQIIGVLWGLAPSATAERFCGAGWPLDSANAPCISFPVGVVAPVGAWLIISELDGRLSNAVTAR